MEKIQLFCLPYAGGSSHIYYEWKHKLASDIEVIPIEYKGHGRFYGDKFYDSIDDASSDICQKITAKIEGEYVIYGHSLGSILAFETTYKLLHSGCRMPNKLILAGIRPPHLIYKDKKYTHLSKEEFMKKVIMMGQTSQEVLDNQELLDYSYEILFADFKIIEMYNPQHLPFKLDIPIVVLAGDRDEEAPEEDMREWSIYTSKTAKLYILEGNHFFAFNHNPSFFRFLDDIIMRK